MTDIDTDNSPIPERKRGSGARIGSAVAVVVRFDGVFLPASFFTSEMLASPMAKAAMVMPGLSF